MSVFAPIAAAHDFQLHQAHIRTIRMTIDAASITTLRQLAMRLCGDAFEFMRIAICAGGARIQVWLCVRQPFADLLSATIVQRFPGAQLTGRSQGSAPA